MEDNVRFKELKDTPVDRFIEDYSGGNETNDQIFSAGKYPKDIELRTDLSSAHISLIQAILDNDNILERCGIGRIYDFFLNKYMRLRVSKDRESRKEYSTANRPDNTMETLQTASNLVNIPGAKK